jgi:hypothetical protein
MVDVGMEKMEGWRRSDWHMRSGDAVKLVLRAGAGKHDRLRHLHVTDQFCLCYLALLSDWTTSTTAVQNTYHVVFWEAIRPSDPFDLLNPTCAAKELICKDRIGIENCSLKPNVD